MNNEQPPDEQIVKRVIQGNIKNFEHIVDRYQKHIFSIGMRFFKNEEDSYDFTQEVFIKAYQNLRSYKGWAPFRFWLIKIAYNHGINKINAIKDEFKLSEESIPAWVQSPENVHFNGEIKTILLNAIDHLPDRYKLCLDLYFFMNFSYREISDITRFPVNTIKSNVFRAKQLLRNKLKGTIAEDYDEV